MDIYVEGRKLRIDVYDILVAGSVGSYPVRFSFAPDWQTESAVAVFEANDSVSRECVIPPTGEVYIPWEVLAEPGSLRIGVYGVDGGRVKPTVWSVQQQIYPGAEPAEPASQHERTPWQEAVEYMDEVMRAADDAKTALDTTRENAESAAASAQSAKKDAQFLSTRSAVWVGEEAPPEDGYDVWVNPEGGEIVIPGGEGAVQSVNGKTGKVHLTAKDVGALPDDTAIPAPYDLPTASASVKGGVKVGNGLVMDGETLVVKPEAEMVLIETIVVGDEVYTIERTKEPDGTPYNFSAVTIRAKFPPSDKTGNLSIFFTFKWPAEIRNYMLYPYHATQERNGYSKCYLSNKRWRGGWWSCALGAGDFAQYYENPVQQEQYGVEDGYISKIRLNHVSGIEEGTIIEIWGVRADA